MKTNAMILMAMAACALGPVAAPGADKEQPAGEAAVEGPTPAQLKARKAKRPVYTKAAEAIKMAEAANQPLMVFMLVEQNDVKPELRMSDFIEKKLMNDKRFRDDLAKQNVVLLKIKIKKDSKNPKKIDLKSLKEAERKLVENFGLDEKAVASAKKQDKPEPTVNDAVNYPALICLSPDGSRQLFRAGAYDKAGGFGVWISTLVDTLRTSGGFEPVISPLIQKIIENPDDQKKWK